LKVTGREVLDVHLAYTNGTTSNSSKGIIPGDGTIVPIKLTFANFGDAPINDMVAVFSTAVPTLVGATIAAVTYPVGILIPTTFYVGTLAPNSTRTVTLFARSQLNCDTMEPLNVVSTYNNIIGLRQTQDNNVVLQVTGHCAQQVLGVEPGSGTAQQIPQAPPLTTTLPEKR
jgi:hypothetical protein